MTDSISKIRVLLADDEIPARQRFARLLSKFSDVEVVGEAGDGLQALEQNSLLNPDVIFLDIEMPELDGLGVAEALPRPGPIVVFVTAFNEHALKAFDLNAVDYVVKPVIEGRLEACIEKIRRNLKDKPAAAEGDAFEAGELRRRISGENVKRRFAVKIGARFVVCDPASVSAVISRDHYSAIIYDGRELLADDSLEQIASRLDSSRFLRIHRGGIINVDFLLELEREGDRKYTAVLKDKERTRVPVSRERLQELKDRLGIS